MELILEGTQRFRQLCKRHWVPAFAGTTLRWIVAFPHPILSSSPAGVPRGHKGEGRGEGGTCENAVAPAQAGAQCLWRTEEIANRVSRRARSLSSPLRRQGPSALFNDQGLGWFPRTELILEGVQRVWQLYARHWVPAFAGTTLRRNIAFPHPILSPSPAGVPRGHKGEGRGEGGACETKGPKSGG